MLADSKQDGSFDGNVDPKTPAEWPSNRHSRRTNLMFCDGHAESASGLVSEELRCDCTTEKNHARNTIVV
jgi:prepilin-type processing-associated H-X9-DG protein